MRRGARRRTQSLPGPVHLGPGLLHPIGIVKDGLARDRAIELLRLGLQLLEPRDVLLVVVQRRIGIHRRLALQQPLQPLGAVALGPASG